MVLVEVVCGLVDRKQNLRCEVMFCPPPRLPLESQSGGSCRDGPYAVWSILVTRYTPDHD